MNLTDALKLAGDYADSLTTADDITNRDTMQVAAALDATFDVTANIRAELARRGRTQESLARALGLSPGAISQRLSGGVRLTVDDLSRIAAFLEVDPADLLKESA